MSTVRKPHISRNGPKTTQMEVKLLATSYLCLTAAAAGLPLKGRPEQCYTLVAEDLIKNMTVHAKPFMMLFKILKKEH